MKLYNSRLQKSLESHLLSIFFTAFGITKLRHLIKEHLESHLFSNHYQDLITQTCLNKQQGIGSHLAATNFNFFTTAPNILKEKSLSTSALTTSYFLQYSYCYCRRFKNSSIVTYSLYQYTRKVVVCMVLTCKWHLEPNIQSEILQQTESIKSIIITTQSMKTLY